MDPLDLPMSAHTDTLFEAEPIENGDPVAVDLVLLSGLQLGDDDMDSSDDDFRPQTFVPEEDDAFDLEAGFVADGRTKLPGVPSVRSPRVKASDVVLTENENGDPVSVYQRLTDYGLLRKITDIVMAKVAMPWTLRDDATQEVHATWARLHANPVFVRNQVARYAYMAGQHAALKLRRDIGAVVAIPGALFRTGRNTAFMESIGAAVNPKDVDDYKDSLELSVEPDELLHLVKVSDTLFEDRLGGLALSPKQRQVAYKALVTRMSADDIAEELDLPLMYIERLLNQVTQKLLLQDGHVEPVKKKPVRVPRGSKKAAADAMAGLTLDKETADAGDTVGSLATPSTVS